jgi:DNA-binding transcriptional ArsR family regulator
MKQIDPTDHIAELARIFSDATRVRIAILLMQENLGMTTMDLCTRLGLLQPRVSSHLSILLKHQIVSVAEDGRQRIYTVNPKVSSILKDLAAFSDGKQALSPQAIKEVKSNSEIRQCRTCYDHLAGVAGVELLQQMLHLGWLSKDLDRHKDKIHYRLTRFGEESLEERRVDLERAQKSMRIFAYGCLDWTEREPHLGGSLGNAVLNSLLSYGVIQRKSGTRALKLVRPISSWLKDDF